MEPRVRYTRAEDGVRIAYWTLGSGPPLFYLTGGPWNHLDLWEVPECRSWYERLGAGRTVVRYDFRGTGHSQREVEDFSLEAQLRDLEAVVEAIGAPRFDVFAAAGSGPVAITYAAQNPERIDHLVLWSSWAAGARAQSPRIVAWRGLVDEDWDLMTDTCAQLVLGWSGGEAGRVAAERLRESVTAAVTRAALDATSSVDARAVLGEVAAPTLVLHRRDVTWLPLEAARELASEIGDARLAILAGDSTTPFVGDADAALEEIVEFLGAAVEAPAPSPSEAAPDDLSERELDVLRLVAGGLANKEIAQRLFLSVRTVERHVANIYDKIGVRGRANATAYALSRGLA